MTYIYLIGNTLPYGFIC